MKLASFDVGIKNLAYCIFEVSGNDVSIEDWKVVDLIESNKVVTQKCSETQKNGKPCTNKAVFVCNGRTYCKSHAERSDIPKYDNSMKKTALGKLSVTEIAQRCSQCIPMPIATTKAGRIAFLVDYYLKHRLVPYKKETRKCQDYDLIEIGKRLKAAGESYFPMEVDLVLIENQISPIANRMKTIQGMLAQFYIMRQDEVDIKFISSQNKLKHFARGEAQGYRANKTDGVKFCRQVLHQRNLVQWEKVLDTPKKDDLADAFLQGVWYIEQILLRV